MPVGLGYRTGGVPEPDPRAEDWWQGTAYPGLRALRDYLVGSPLEAASMSGVPVVSDVADVALAGRDLGRLAATPSRDTAIDAALSTAGAALPFFGAGMLKAGRRAGRLEPDVVFSTHEAVPYAKSGHLEGIVEQPEDVRAAYSRDPRASWRNDEGEDILHAALGDRTLPTREGTGTYTPPSGGGLETNPLQIARMPVPEPGRPLSPDDAQRINAANAARGYGQAQGGDPWHRVIFDVKPGEATGLFMPLGRGLDPDEARRLQETVQAIHPNLTVADTGRGVSILNTAEEGKEEIYQAARRAGLERAVRKAAPKGSSRPVEARFEGDYPFYEPAWEAGEGSGEATRLLRSRLSEEQIDRLDRSPDVKRKFLELLELDDQTAARMGGRPRSDIQNARYLVGNHGFRGLFRALDRNTVALPAATLAVLLKEAGVGEEEPPGR